MVVVDALSVWSYTVNDKKLFPLCCKCGEPGADYHCNQCGQATHKRCIHTRCLPRMTEISTLKQHATFDKWFDAGRSKRETWGAPPEIGGDIIAVVHPEATHPWAEFCDWLGTLAAKLHSPVHVMKLNSMWMVISTTELSGTVSTDQWFGEIDADGNYKLLGAS